LRATSAPSVTDTALSTPENAATRSVSDSARSASARAMARRSRVISAWARRVSAWASAWRRPTTACRAFTAWICAASNAAAVPLPRSSRSCWRVTALCSSAASSSAAARSSRARTSALSASARSVSASRRSARAVACAARASVGSMVRSRSPADTPAPSAKPGARYVTVPSAGARKSSARAGRISPKAVRTGTSVPSVTVATCAENTRSRVGCAMPSSAQRVCSAPKIAPPAVARSPSVRAVRNRPIRARLKNRMFGGPCTKGVGTVGCAQR